MAFSKYTQRCLGACSEGSAQQCCFCPRITARVGKGQLPDDSLRLGRRGLPLPLGGLSFRGEPGQLHLSQSWKGFLPGRPPFLAFRNFQLLLVCLRRYFRRKPLSRLPRTRYFKPRAPSCLLSSRFWACSQEEGPAGDALVSVSLLQA